MMNKRVVLTLAGVIVAGLLAMLFWQQGAERRPSPPQVIAPEPVVPVQRARPEGPPVLVIAAPSEELRRFASTLAGAYLQRIGFRIDPGSDHLVIGREGGRVAYVDLAGAAGQVQIEFGLVEGYAQSDPAIPRVVIGLVARDGANATPLAVRSENDLSTRRLTLTARGDATAIGEFIAFALSREGQIAIESSGAQGVSGVIAEETVPSNAPADYHRIARRALRTSFTIRFRPGTDDHDDKARDDVQRIADLMRDPQNAGRQVRLLGFTNGDGAAEASRALAQSVADRLETLAVPVGEVIGLGAALPLDSNETPAGRWRNRRVEVWINR